MVVVGSCACAEMICRSGSYDGGSWVGPVQNLVDVSFGGVETHFYGQTEPPDRRILPYVSST